MAAMAVVLLVASVSDAFHGRWLLAGKELLGISIPIIGAWAGWKLLRAIPVFFDKIWPETSSKQ
jgi:hypothetical protein